ncbi:MAG: murein biosynthesis integral membrane protein MurJ [Synechococcales cyanobacterium CRU_2_2]|nr:murein biosynthesis integral membrane protein MurJ [Synechococcales cyanobacterium CRU_2_2]
MTVPEESQSSPTTTQSQKTGRSLAGIAGIVAIATLLSKVMGLARQVAIASAFGVGPAVGAYEFASIIPGFFLILLGGINGPFHSAIVSALAKRDRQESGPLIERISTLVGLVLLGVTLIVVAAAPLMIDLLAPGLQATAPEVRAIAIRQLQIMAPMAWFAGMIGIGFGALNAADQYWLPSISPLLSSLAVILGIGALGLTLGPEIMTPQYALLGGIVLAITTLSGTILQWLAQVWAQKREGLGNLRLRFGFDDPGVRDVMRVLGPALFASGMLQINVYTDMFFTSFLPNPAASVSALNYANLLVQAPLGVLSNMILVPFLPVFSRLRDPQDWPELKERIRQGLVLTAIAMLPLGSLIFALAKPIVQVVYERGAFQSDASAIVAPVLMAYSVGMFVYLGRDVLVRVFYGLGDGTTPFRISMVNILVNAVLDFIFVRVFGWGTPGLVLATVGVNVASMVALLWFLNQRLNGLPLQRWLRPLLGLTGASVFAGVTAYVVMLGIESWVSGSRGLAGNFFGYFVEMAVSGSVGLAVFGLMAARLRLPEFDQFVGRIRQVVRR